MSTKTVSLSEDAYERLKSLKEDKESFSDVVRRVTETSNVSKFHGALSEDTADEVEENISENREGNRERHSERVKSIADDLE
jgi:predicted CopG family antitoxin